MADKLLTDLFRAYFDARRNKRGSCGQIAFEMDLEHNIVCLYEDIKNRSYKPAPSICFIVERPVKREVFASEFRDRVVHHLLFNYMEPYFSRRMIFDSYSCRKGKGNSEGISRLQHHILSCSDNYRQTAYVLKMDLTGYFMSIDKQILYGLIEPHLLRLCREQDVDIDLVEYLLRIILFRAPVKGCRRRGDISDWEGLPPSKSLFNAPDGVGLPIGDLTSQLFSNIYLNELDQFVKRSLKFRHYGRYVDDFYMVSEEKWQLKAAIPVIREFLRDRLHLSINEKKTVLRDAKDGIEFVGGFIKPYRIYPTHRSVGIFHEAVCHLGQQNEWETFSEKKIKATLPVLNSYLGHLSHYRAFRTLRRQFSCSNLKLYYRFSADYKKAAILFCMVLAFIVSSCSTQGNGKTSTECGRQIETAFEDSMLHYWDKFPFSDKTIFSDSLFMQQTLIHWLQRVEQQPDSITPSYAKASITAGHGHPEGQKAMFLWLESMLNDPNSPFRNEEMFIPVLEAMTDDSLIADIDKERPRFLLQKAMMNRKGTQASNLSFLTEGGRRMSLYQIKADRVLLYFFNPDCHDCKRVGAILQQEPLLQELQNDGKLKIVAVYPDEDLTAWNKARGSYPADWITGRIDRDEERTKFYLPAIPSLYLLDSSHTVILKDAPIETIITTLKP